ncbi:MAG TPA: DNA cytosine methyltransferase [Chitinophagaceae bacterium]
MINEPIFLYIDLFCGAGGTTTGIVQAELEGHGIAKVIACVNHDPLAIKSHWENHPEVKHFEEDIRTLDLTELTNIVKFQKELYPDAYIILWASLECTNFSKAKGGQPRDADSRTLADHLERYILALKPDFIQIENVVEFMSWGPLDENGKPVSRKNGSDWMRWRNEINSLGYRDEWKEMNSANFGAYTSRNRLFGCFAKDDLPIVWPKATHSKKPSQNSMYGDLKKWKPVKDVLNFEDEGESIFTRKKPLSDKTLERIYAGLVKYIAKGDTSFISKYYSGRPAGKVASTNSQAGTITTVGNQALVQTEFLMQSNGGLPSAKVYSADSPSRVVTTSDNQSLVQPKFLLKYNSTDKNGKHTPPSIEDPCPVVSTQGRLGIVQTEFLQHYYGNGFNTSTDEPCPTLTTKERCALVQPKYLINYNHSSKVNDINDSAPTLLTRDKLGLVQPKYFIDQQYGQSKPSDVESVAGSITNNPKLALVACDPFIMPTNFDNKPKSIDEPLQTITANRKHHYLVNPSWGGNPGSVESPCCVIVARQDKAPLYFVQVEKGNIAIAVFDCDTEVMIRIKQFMSIYGLVDIKMRMLRVLELLKIQGFPAQYKLEGNQSDQKKFIGNSVVPQVVKCWVEAMAMKLIEAKTKAA